MTLKLDFALSYALVHQRYTRLQEDTTKVEFDGVLILEWNIINKLVAIQSPKQAKCGDDSVEELECSISFYRRGTTQSGRELGHSFLKMLVAVDLFLRHLDWDEARLTVGRSNALSTIWGMKREVERIGRAFHNGGIGCAMQRALASLENMDDIHRWNDFVGKFASTRPSYTISLQGMPDIQKVEGILGYTFRDKRLALEALSMRRVGRLGSYQRLEFLGDAVIDAVSARFWTTKFPEYSNAQITILRSLGASNKALQAVCISVGLYRHIWNVTGRLDKLPRARESLVRSRRTHCGTFYWTNAVLCRTLADVVESCIGAVFLDSGLSVEEAARVWERIFWPFVGRRLMTNKNWSQ
ncbi:MAG: ribonuclease III domain-containing protein [Benniella sp.]|nr:MAG: ribonuclease III domain-containing protein [Benniella sp.]KAK3807804.1 MAG: ribonuclease III domain-containing protein [Benniella sp.]